MINHEVARYLIFVSGFIAFMLVFYRPNIRRQIATSFKLGSPVAVAYFTPPILEHGWSLKTGKPPECSLLDVPGVGVSAALHADGGSAVIQYDFTDVDPSARYVVIRANRLGITLSGEWYLRHTMGLALRVFCKARRKSDGQIIDITIMPNLDLDTVRCGGTHSWVVNAASFTDHHKFENAVLDLNVLKRMEYTASNYQWFGISGFELTIGAVSIVRLAAFQKSTIAQKVAVARNWTTWFPWH